MDRSPDGALYWRDIYLEMLAVNQQTLHRMRDLLASHSDGPEGLDADVNLIEADTAKFTDRLAHWQQVVDGSPAGPPPPLLKVLRKPA